MKSRKICVFICVIICSYLCLFIGCEKKPTQPPTYDTSLLNAIRFPTSPPKVDGDASDPAWTFAPAREVIIGTKIVTMKAVWSPYPDSTAGYLWLLATWQDASFGIVANGSWLYSNSAWSKSALYEDAIELVWDTPNTGIDKDIWYIGAAKTLGSRSTTDIPGGALQDIQIDTTVFEADTEIAYIDTTVTPPETTWVLDPINLVCHIKSRKFTFVGYADDKYLKNAIIMDDNGTSCYSLNANADTTAPREMQPSPKEFIDLMILQSGEGTNVTGLNVDSIWAANYDSLGVVYNISNHVWTKVDSLGPRVIPVYILRTPSQSKADIVAAASWTDGVWVVELRRVFNTFYTDDVVFDTLKDCSFTIKLMDNCSEANAVTSGHETLHFIK
ncbi:MAG: hypothetical protein QMD71_06130 [bacterium]|nr:hypothetical protein [bacterium]